MLTPLPSPHPSTDAVSAAAGDRPTRPRQRLRVVVLTCSEMGWEMAGHLAGSAAAELLAVVSAPQRKRPIAARLRSLRRKHGVLGASVEAAHLVAGRMARTFDRSKEMRYPHPAGVHDMRFRDLHADDCIAALRALAPDLAVVDGTYILQPHLFDLPLLGSINLHCGKLPEYRGAPPVFWELMNGETRCGVSVHHVTARVDEGVVYNQQLLPLDPAPRGDPIEYARRFWLEQLRPVGLQLVTRTIAEIAAGTAAPKSQPNVDAQTNRMPDRAAKAELRRRVAERRASLR